MNRHLSIFRPYSNAGHEDSLTRAALLVMHLVPLAHEAFLGLIDADRLARLPPAEFDMQTGTLSSTGGGSGSDDGNNDIASLVSVFLGPHESFPTDAGELDLESERKARYDGVIQYGDTLLVVIESKLFEGEPDWQSLAINTTGVSFGSSDRKLVTWPVLLDLWWRLLEQEILSATERSVVIDFFDYAEDHFGWLLPFTDLARCGDNPGRRGRRLKNILSEVTGKEATQHAARATVRVPAERIKAIQRIDLYAETDQLVLAMWPGELKAQAQHLYGSPERVEALLRVTEMDEWSLKPCFNVAYRNANYHARWYTTPSMDGATYAKGWTRDLENAGGWRRERLENGELWAWLLDRGYAVEEDRPGLNRLLETRVQDFHARPTLEIRRSWSWAEAVEADDGEGRLIDEIGEAITAVLAAVDQPLPGSFH